MAGTEWYAVEVGGAISDLTSNLNTLESQGYEIFSVVISPRGWTVVARKPKAEEKKPEEPAHAEAVTGDAPHRPRRGTVAFKPHKK